jgi:hypothetical protein
MADTKPAGAHGDGLLTIDDAMFARHFDRAPFTIAHHLSAHPLFALPRLVELARGLPANAVEYNAGNLPVSADPRLTPKTGLSAEETIRRIEECNSWMVLKNVEQVTIYRELLEACLAEVGARSESIRPGMRQFEGFVFVSSANAVTPFHMDPEHNFLLQIHGSKTVTVFDGHDRSLLPIEQVEEFYAGATHRNMPFADAWALKGRQFELAPGQGLHIPVTFPHHVRVGPGYSVSFSITFRTPDLARRAALHRLNHRLRQRGLKPRPPGQSPWLDAVKLGAMHLLQRLRGQTPSSGP